MTSVVDTSVKYFDHTMLNSPVLTRLAGSKVALLDALLLNGYDTKATTSVTVAGNTVTLAFAGTHSAIVGSVILVSGSDEAALNGEQKVTAVDSSGVKFQTAGVSAGAKTGATTFKMAPLGFSKPFTGTNQGVYKSVAVGANGHFLRIVDTTVAYCRATGYESMTAVGTGTGLFPSAAQQSGGVYWPKAFDPGDGSNPPAKWFLCGDSRLFYIGIGPYWGMNNGVDPVTIKCFGDPIALRTAGDSFSTVLNGTLDVTNPDYMTQGGVGLEANQNTFHPRAYTGLGTAVSNYMCPYEGTTNLASGRDDLQGPFPSRIDGGLRLSPMRMNNLPYGNEPRADMPGLYWVPQSNTVFSFQNGDRITGTGFLAGRKLTAARVQHGGASSTGPQPSTTGVVFFDTTGPWR